MSCSTERLNQEVWKLRNHCAQGPSRAKLLHLPVSNKVKILSPSSSGSSKLATSPAMALSRATAAIQVA